MTKVTVRDRRRIMIWSLSILALGFYLSVFTFKYWSQILENNQEKNNLEEKYNKLLENEKDLTSEVTKLQDPDYVAKFARDKYLYSKPGELIIRIAE